MKKVKPSAKVSLPDTGLCSAFVPISVDTVSGNYQLTVGLGDGQLALITISESDGRLISTEYYDAHAMGIQVIRWFEMQDAFLLTGGQDGKLKKWSFQNNSLVETHSAKAKSSWINSICVVPTENGDLIATASGKIVQLWSLDLKLVHQFEPCVSTVTFLDYSAPSKCLLGCAYGQVIMWDMTDTQSFRKVKTFEEKGSFLQVLAMPKTCCFVGAMQDPMVDIWSFQVQGTNGQSQMKKSISPDQITESLEAKQNQMAGYQEKVMAVATDIDGRYLFTAGGQHAIVFDLGKDQKYLCMEKPRQMLCLGHRNLIQQLKTHPIHKHIFATICKNGQINVWSILDVMESRKKQEIIYGPIVADVHDDLSAGVDISWHQFGQCLCATFGNGDLFIYYIS